MSAGTDGSSPFDAYLRSFQEAPGYLNFASYGPPSLAVIETIGALAHDASLGRASAQLHAQDRRGLAAVSRLTGFDPDAVTLTTSTSLGLLQVAFGLPRGEVLVSEAEFPANLYAWWRSEDAGLTRVRSLPIIAGGPLAPVTPERVAAAVRPDTVAVAVSAVDFRTGTRADLAGLREAVGDRLLIVDGIQGFGVLDIDWTVADALVVGGQKWLRAGWGAGFTALSPRALERLLPRLGGWTGVEDPSRYDGRRHPPLPGAQRLSVTNASPFASGALATALEVIETVGVAAIHDRIAATAERLIAGLAEAGVSVLSPTRHDDRAGIVVARTPSGNASSATDRLADAGITVTGHGPDRVRFSVHATTTTDAIDAAVEVMANIP
ncbi:aminotransferase class V-fold PLP-dependent enzyme [Microbacterium sp. H37-C3]|uniref:aminotransferase class V-fold PLP-dependent enzyme n=1 Tax=Microbacterium sp. H37-C3 TaxID=3004354 RepID=UPI0022AF08B1|nr:aminotransferase class V-fold PLP-dependent enzyme [Microbacterium sp. H37-C3]MCZ4068846.1 aminotransferase class V-fold PLP-dependent enzyme [Microbacterium sp. H37-C3]